MLVHITPLSSKWAYKIQAQGKVKRYVQITENHFGYVPLDVTKELKASTEWEDYKTISLPKISMEKLRIRYPTVTVPVKEVFIENGTIRINDKIMRVGDYYPISYQGKEYLVHKSDEDTIEIIELVK